MKDYEKDYKSMLNKVSLEKEELNAIKKTILSSKKSLAFKFRYAIIIIGIFLIGTTIVYGKELINIYKEYIIRKETYKNEDGETVSHYKGYFRDFIEIPNSNPYSEDDIGKYFTYEEIEKTLGIKLLKNPSLEENSFELYKLEYNDQKQIAKIYFSSEHYIAEMRYRFSFFTQYATDEQKEEANLIVGERRKPIVYHIKSLDVDANIIEITMDGVDTSYYLTYASASFPYNGIMYRVVFNKFGYKIEDFYPILETLEF